MKPNGQIYVFCATKQLPLYISTFEEEWFFRNLLVWSKTNPAPRLSKTNFVFANKYIVYAINEKGRPTESIFNFPEKTNVKLSNEIFITRHYKFRSLEQAFSKIKRVVPTNGETDVGFHYLKFNEDKEKYIISPNLLTRYDDDKNIFPKMYATNGETVKFISRLARSIFVFFICVNISSTFRLIIIENITINIVMNIIIVFETFHPPNIYEFIKPIIIPVSIRKCTFFCTILEI